MRECQMPAKKDHGDEAEKETLKNAYMAGRDLLRRSGIPEPDLDAWYLLEYVTGVSRASYYGNPQREMTEQQRTQYEACLRKRSSRIPLQHITGEQEFMGMTFCVNEHVLIPRQDTETLAELALDILERGEIPEEAGRGQARILDMCTGSGCILLSVLHFAARSLESTGADLSEEALAVAAQNAERLGIRAEFIRGDLFENISGRYGMIISNPPYIRSAEIETLQEEVRLHDPREALDGREDGLYFYRRIVSEAREHLEPGGVLAFEIGYDQAEAVSSLLEQAGYTQVSVKKDLAGLDRVVSGVYNNL